MSNMKLRFRTASIFVAVSAGLMSCSKSPPRTSESVAETEFKAHLQSLQRNTTNEIVAPISYDIRKTDSLVSPFVGQIEWTDVLGLEEDFRMDVAHRLTLVYQEGKWVVKMSEARVIDTFADSHQMAGEWHDEYSVKAIYARRLGIPYQ